MTSLGRVGKITFLLIVLFVSARCHAVSENGPTLIYKTVEGQDLRLYAFYPWRKPDTISPAIVLFHGGGWKHGNAGKLFAQCRYLASRGMVAFSVEYRTHDEFGTSPFAAVRDAKSAIRWVRAHARELRIDPNRIAAGGGSAGGQMAAAAGTIDGEEERNEDLSVSSRPNALVLFNPVIDNGPGGYGFKRLGNRYREISPLHNINKTHPPTIILTGDRDVFVTLTAVKHYKELLKNVGVRCDLHIYPGQLHGFYRFRAREKNANYVKTMREVDKFLRSLGYLRSAPNPSLASWINFGSTSAGSQTDQLLPRHL